VGIMLGQLPPAELARLKAELAETLIANFCYPRFYDYRTNSLRMRPVDRAKRQEVWHFLSTYDFNSWGRVDVMTSDFQRYLERLFIQYVQRNRSFFGEQGRKRMGDVRMLITSSSTILAESFRGHLSGRPTNPPFGSPRPVISWSKANRTGYLEIEWEQIVSSTMILQQQLQEIRGEVKTPVAGDLRPIAPLETAPSGNLPPSGPRRVTRSRPLVNGKTEAPAPPARSAQKPAEVRLTPVPANPKTPLPPASPVVPSVPAASAATSGERKIEPVAASPLPPAPPPPMMVRERIEDAPTQQVYLPEVAHPVAPVKTRELARSAHTSVVEAPVPAKQPNKETVLLSDEDVVIFEQMRHQLVVWLRIEAVRAGIDITGQGPAQLMEELRQQEDYDEARLHVVSSLLNLANQVISNGYADLADYKQAMMFYLMHTRRH